ncbi:MAG: hypothetical protein ACTSVI_09450 [Promethearchaeota archaeon]
MGRRKRKQQKYRPQRKPPKIFACPHCGAMAMKVEELNNDEENGYAIIKCGKCGLEARYPAGPLTEPVDVYGSLIDEFYGETPDNMDAEEEKTEIQDS